MNYLPRQSAGCLQLFRQRELYFRVYSFDYRNFFSLNGLGRAGERTKRAR